MQFPKPYPPDPIRYVHWDQLLDYLYDRKRLDRLGFLLSRLPKVTTTDADYIERDEGALLVELPQNQSAILKTYLTARIIGTDIGARIVKHDGYDPGGTVLEAREWSGTRQHEFYWHDVTERIVRTNVVELRLGLKTTGASGVLLKGSMLMAVFDWGFP